MQPKAQHEITRAFNDLINHIVNETAMYYLFNAKLAFTHKRYSYALTNTVYFSMQEYHKDFNLTSMTEYKKVVEETKLPHYVDCNRTHRILTPDPHIYTLLHEIAHIITHILYPDAPDHGKEFCDNYVRIIELVKPKTISPLSGGFITWN